MTGARVFETARLVARRITPGDVDALLAVEKAGMRRADLRRNGDGTFTRVFEWRADATRS